MGAWRAHVRESAISHMRFNRTPFCSPRVWTYTSSILAAATRVSGINFRVPSARSDFLFTCPLFLSHPTILFLPLKVLRDCDYALSIGQLFYWLSWRQPDPQVHHKTTVNLGVYGRLCLFATALHLYSPSATGTFVACRCPFLSRSFT